MNHVATKSKEIYFSPNVKTNDSLQLHNRQEVLLDVA